MSVPRTALHVYIYIYIHIYIYIYIHRPFFYSLFLSWLHTFCLSKPQACHTSHCDLSNERPYLFIVNYLLIVNTSRHKCRGDASHCTPNATKWSPSVVNKKRDSWPRATTCSLDKPQSRQKGSRAPRKGPRAQKQNVRASEESPRIRKSTQTEQTKNRKIISGGRPQPIHWQAKRHIHWYIGLSEHTRVPNRCGRPRAQWRRSKGGPPLNLNGNTNSFGHLCRSSWKICPKYTPNEEFC